MASTYTTRLRLVKQAYGENIDTWGVIWNSSGGSDLIDFAIAGVVTIPLAATNYVLTSANGSTDESRAAVLNCAGILSANVQIIAPNVQKTYIVYNGTTGAFTLGIRTAGGSAVEIAQGTSVAVWCNGNDGFFLVGSTDEAEVQSIIDSYHDTDLNAHYAASDTQRGFVELATSAEVIAGADTARAVTPAGLAALTSTDTRRGLVELATNAEALAGIDTARAITPAALAAVVAATSGLGTADFGASNSGASTSFLIPGSTYDILIQIGETSPQFTSGGEFADTVTFPITFGSVPAVIVSANSTGAAAAIYAWVTESGAPTVSGFGYGVAERADGFDFTAKITWIAIGRAP